MEHRITVDGQERVLDIRAMDESFIVWRKIFTAPLTARNMETADPEYLATGRAEGRFDVVREFFRRQIQAIGSCMILAWDGDGVVGKMHFTTREMHEAIGGPERWDSPVCYCVDHHGFAPAIRALSDQDMARLLGSPSRTLRIVCFNIGHSDERYHGQGIAKAMVEYLKHWAGERGWRRLEATSCPDITPPIVLGDWMLRRGTLERRGFRVSAEMPAPPNQVAKCTQVIRDLASGMRDIRKCGPWYARQFPRLLADSSWRRQVDKAYLMACDL